MVYNPLKFILNLTHKLDTKSDIRKPLIPNFELSDRVKNGKIIIGYSGFFYRPEIVGNTLTYVVKNKDVEKVYRIALRKYIGEGIDQIVVKSEDGLIYQSVSFTGKDKKKKKKVKKSSK